MTSPVVGQVSTRLEATFGRGRIWKSQTGPSATAWETPSYHLLWTNDAASDVDLRTLWDARKGRQPYPVVLLAPSDDESKVRVTGPQDSRPVRDLPVGRVVDLLETSRGLSAREAASFLAREFNRLEEAVIPGLRVKDLLTPHFLLERLLRWPENEQRLWHAVENTSSAHGVAWRSLFQGMGYQVEQLPRRGYLLRYDNSPIAVVHPHRTASQFRRLTENGELPEGMVLADCEQYGAHWGILAAEGRYRLFQRRPPVGPATGQYVELDTDELERKDRFYLGLLAPESLKENGWLTSWVGEAKDFGEGLRKGLEERLIGVALPSIARGLGEWLESQDADISNSDQLRQIEEAALTLVFRFMFLLHTEARGYLPFGSAAYRPHSARQLAEDSRPYRGPFGRKSTQRWDRLRTLIRMVRSGDRSAGVPAYNGSLFAAASFPGSDLLEKADVADVYLAPALTAIAFETDKADATGLDYAGLQIGHLGAIYEALLTLRLTRAPEDLAYDAKQDVFRPLRAGEHPEVSKAQLYYQTEAGGRKAGGVFYTRHEFVDHLLNHSLMPALDDHLDDIKKLAERDPTEAARRLFDFSVVDPAMGSAHFLTAALDMIADHIELFLAQVGGLPGIAQQLSELSQDSGQVAQQPDDGDLLRRLILKRCIYGVDISPMAVEVANVTLWLASFVPGLALSYLGSNLKCGDALIGVADPLVVGASDSPMFTGQAVAEAMTRAADFQRKLAENPDRTPEEVNRSQELSTELREATGGLRAAFDLWAAEPLGLNGARYFLETNAEAIIASDEGGAKRMATELSDASDIAARYRFFHWPLEFPSVFHRERRGFDVVVGNPPWNKVKFEMPSFLALHDPGIRGLRSGIERDERANRLFEQRPELRQEIEDTRQQIEEQREFFRPENGYTIQGSGDTDLYKLFCERYASIARKRGFIGVVLPRVAFLNDGSRGFRRWFFKGCRPSRIDALLNSGRWAFDMEGRYTVALTAAQVGVPVDGTLTITGPARNEREFAECITNEGVQIDLAALASWTPAPMEDAVKEPTWELPLLPTSMHVSILSKLRRGVRFDRLQNPNRQKNSKGFAAAPSATLYRELDSAQQRSLFTHPQGEGRIPVWKGSSFDQYDPYDPDHPDEKDLAGYGSPTAIESFLQKKRSRSREFRRAFPASVLNDPLTLPYRHPRIAFRAVTNRTNSRTAIGCLVPARTPLTDRAPYIAFHLWEALEQSFVLGVFNSIPFDWQARRSVETTLNYFILNGLTFPPPDDTPWERIGRLAARLSCVDERFAEFAEEIGVECGPLTNAQRNGMKAEIDALVASAYGLTRDELRFIFTDFTENAVSPAYREQVREKFDSIKAAKWLGDAGGSAPDIEYIPRRRGELA